MAAGTLFKGILFVLVVPVLFGVAALWFWPEAEVPSLSDNWWGYGEPQADDTTIRDFQIKVSNEVLTDLKTRLLNYRFGADLIDTQFQYGFPASQLRKVVEHWKTKYSWKTYEAELNKYKHYKTKIEGIDVHYLRVSPTRKGVTAKPLLMIHGWPGSVWEFYKIIPLLTDPADPEAEVFEVICPSIPGYGFSEAPHRKGFNTVAAAQVMHKLMTRLGHAHYYVQGGDWGSVISTIMAQTYRQHVDGIHVNMVVPPKKHPAVLIHNMMATLMPGWFEGRVDFKLILQEMGYLYIQATKPDTVAAALNDSPVGLAAYILEKFSTWTNSSYRDLPDGGLGRHWSMDELLTNVMIYWTTGSIGSSVRLYKESLADPDGVVDSFDLVPVKVPAGLAGFPGELFVAPKSTASYRYKNIVQYTHMPRGGHFAAFEEPKLLAEDIQSFVRKVEQKRK